MPTTFEMTQKSLRWEQEEKETPEKRKRATSQGRCSFALDQNFILVSNLIEFQFLSQRVQQQTSFKVIDRNWAYVKFLGA